MPTVQTNLALIRQILDEPDPARPKEHILFQLFADQVMHQSSQMVNSGAPWSVSSELITAVAGVEDYQVLSTNFGKPFWVHSEDPTDAYKPRIEIPFSMIQNADLFYQGPRQVYSSNDNNPRAVVISFYRTSASYYARITPVPGGTCYYRVWYEVAPDQPASLGDTPGLTPFHHLLRIQTAIAALPYCAWGRLACDAESDRDVGRWEKKCAALALSFTRQEGQFQREFSTYLGSLMQTGVEPRDGWGDPYMEDAFYAGTLLGPNRIG